MIVGGTGASSWGVLFDLDDTLYPRAAYIDSAFQAVTDFLTRTRGLPATAVIATLREAHGRATGKELQETCERFALPATLVWHLRQVMRDHQPRLQLPAASRDVLLRLRREEWRVGVLTNGLPAVQRRKVRALGLGSLVDHVIFAEEHSRRGKPEPRAFRAALERLRLEPSRCVFVGDDPDADMRGARAVGLNTVWVRRIPGGHAGDVPADGVVARVWDVRDVVARLRTAGVQHAA